MTWCDLLRKMHGTCQYTRVEMVGNNEVHFYLRSDISISETLKFHLASNYKVAIVTGASRGIGAALAKSLAACGINVGLLARNRESLDSLARQINQFDGGRALPVACDVSDRQSVLSAIDEVKEGLGAVDLLVANAGISQEFSAKRYNSLAAETVWQVNVLGAVYAIEGVLADMQKRQQGHIVGISSLASYVAIPGHGAYCASKSALSVMLASLRGEVERRNISVTTICPGYIKTDMTAKNDFSMPFLMELEDANTLILNAIARRKRVVNFPWQLYYLIRSLRRLPWFVQRRLYGGWR